MAAEVDNVMTPSANYYEVLGIDEDKVKVLQIHKDSVPEYSTLELGWVVDSLTLMSYT